MLNTIERVAERLRAYEATQISRDIFVLDTMFARGIPGAMEHYISVGRSAIDLLASAMIAAQRTEFASILDLPSGAGRVTRHLRALFPDAALFVSDLDIPCSEFAAETFSARTFIAPPDFVPPPTRTFDLIFVGSLFTHLDAVPFARTMRWMIDALSNKGILIITTHGRRHDFIERTAHRSLSPEVWDRVAKDKDACGFGYVETQIMPGGFSYGLSWSTPSWLMRLVENDPTVRLVGFQEAAWDDHQDVLILQMRLRSPLVYVNRPRFGAVRELSIC